MTSRLSWQSCWLSMLPQGPVDKNDGKLNHLKPYNLQCHLRQHAAASISTQWISTNSWSNDQREVFWRSQGEFHLNKNMSYARYLHTCAVHFCSIQRCRKLSHAPLPSCLHPRSLLARCTGPTPEHLSNTTNVGQVSNTTGTPRDSMFFHHSETWRSFLLWIFPPVVNNCAKSSPIRQLYFLNVLSVLIE